MTNLEYYRQHIKDDVEELTQEHGYEYEEALGIALEFLFSFNGDNTNVLDWLCKDYKETKRIK